MVVETHARTHARHEFNMHVIFFKDDDDDGSYSSAVLQLGHTASYCPLLDVATLQSSLPTLDAALGGSPPPRCIAVTSRHAAAILRDACVRVHAGHGAAACAALRAAPVFAVGARTAAALRGAPCLAPAATCSGGGGGGGSGGAAELAPLVVASSSAGGGGGAVLFVCGEGRLDALPTAVRAAGVPLLEVAAYRATAAPEETLRERWGRALEAAPSSRCCVLFSPSGVTAAVGAGLLPAELHLAIGATTAAALRATGLECSGVATSPTAQGVADALAAALAGRSE